MNRWISSFISFQLEDSNRMHEKLWRTTELLLPGVYSQFWTSFGPTAVFQGSAREGLGSRVWVRTSPPEPWGLRLKLFFGTLKSAFDVRTFTRTRIHHIHYHYYHPLSFIIIVHLFTLSRVKNKHVLYPSESIEILLSCRSFESYAAMHRINMLLFHFEVWGFKWRKKERRGCHSKSFGRSCLGRDEDIEDPKVSQVIEVVWKGTQCHCKLQVSKVFSVKSIILGSHHT